MVDWLDVRLGSLELDLDLDPFAILSIWETFHAPKNIPSGSRRENQCTSKTLEATEIGWKPRLEILKEVSSFFFSFKVDGGNPLHQRQEKQEGLQKGRSGLTREYSLSLEGKNNLLSLMTRHFLGNE